MYDYVEEFNKAIDYTKQHVFVDFSGFSNNRYFTSNQSLARLSEALEKKLEEIPKEKYPPGMRSFGIAQSIIANCGPFHFYIKETIEQLYNCKTYLTLGYISLGKEKYYHKITNLELEESFKTKKFPDHHIWLTLDSGELIDLTFGLTFRSINTPNEFEEDLKNGVPLYPIAKHPDFLTGDMQYHPIAVGDNILKKGGYNLDLLAKILYG